MPRSHPLTTRPPAGVFLSPYGKRHPSTWRGAVSDQDAAQDEFEERLELLGSILEAVELRGKALSQRAAAAEQEAGETAHRQGGCLRAGWDGVTRRRGVA